MTKKVLVWDLPLRVFHWLLVTAIMGSWYTSNQDNDLIDYHLIFGYVTLGLIIFRILWGFLGTTHAKFSQFIPTPNKVVHYLKHFKHPQQTTYTGHNPLGALMVVFMLTIVLLQAVSGLFMNDDIFTTGPYYGTINDEIGNVLIFFHRNSFNFILGAIALHLLAILFYKVIKKKSLVVPMITGKKSSQDVGQDDGIKHSKLIVAIILTLIITVFVYWLVILNAPVMEEYY